MNSASESRSSPPATVSPFVALLLVLLAIACYVPSLVDRDGRRASEFFSDDLRFVADNTQNFSAWAMPWRYFTETSLVATPEDLDIYRPLRTWSFALDYRMFGASPFAYRAHNVALHAFVTLLLFILLRRTPVLKDGAALAAACFAAHPLATEAVAWISSRADLQAALAVLITLLLARRAESGGNVAVVAIAAAVCGFAKESACVVPALLCIDHRLRHGRFERSLLPTVVAASLGVAVYLAFYLSVRERGITGQVDYYGGSFATHLPYAILGIGRQLSLLVWPSRLNFNYEPALFSNPSGGSVAVAAMLIFGAVAGLGIALRRNHALVLGGLFYAIALAPSANILLPLRSVLAERFAYVPLVGFAMAIAAVAPALAGILRRFSRVVPISLALLLVGTFALRTASRAAEHRSAYSMYLATADAWPESFSAALGLGNVALERGENRVAIEAFERAVELGSTDSALVWKAKIALGRALVLAPDLQRAIATLAESCAMAEREPGLSNRLPALDAEARFALGTALALAQRYTDAASVYDDLLRRHGESAQRLDARAEVERARVGDTNLIIDLYQRALVLDPNYHKARIHLATFFRLFPTLEAEGWKQLREVLYRDPHNEEARRIEQDWKNEKGQ